jgi:hypothetical protein
MLTISTTNTQEVSRQLKATEKAIPERMADALKEVGRLVQSEAERRCPQSPTAGQAKAAGMKGRKRGRAPGTLTRAIKVIEKTGYVMVGVFTGAALKYANYIHNGQGTKWHKIGPGSKAKQNGPKVGGEFLTRAYDENEDELQRVYEKKIAEALP